MRQRLPCNLNAGIMFGISEESARRYRILYEKSQGIEHGSRRAHKAPVNTVELITPGEPMSTSDDYSSMTREELIEELMKSKIREARLKKDITRNIFRMDIVGLMLKSA